MAHMKAIYSWAFILAVIACHEILFTEGRQLKSIKKQGNNTGKHGSKTINSQKPPTRKESDVQVTSADDSPRVDHSVVRKKQTFPPPPNQSLGISTVSEPIDDFRPTTPGYSPGIGHSYTDHNVEIQPNGVGNGPGVPHSISNNTDDFRPTGPGHSPGIGHSSQNKHAEPNA